MKRAWLRNLKPAIGAGTLLILIGSTPLIAQRPLRSATSIPETTMSSPAIAGQMIWSSEHQTFEGRSQVSFSLDLMDGLRDGDFYLIGPGGWDPMKSPSVDAVAVLDVSPDSPLSKIYEAISEIRTKGDYRTVVLLSRYK